MNLVLQKEKNNHTDMVIESKETSTFLRHFYFVSIFLIPLIIFSSPAVKYLGIPDFVGRNYLEFIFASIIFYFSLVFFKHAKMEIKMRQYGMMTLVSLGVGSGYIFSALSTFIPAINTEFYLEISTLIWILLLGHFLESKSSTAAGDALQEVAKLLPKEVHLKTKSGIKEVEINLLKIGDIVLVKPGEKVPADGIIIKGRGNFNESHITGESKPVEKIKESKVIAGAISLDGSVEIKVLQVGESSTIGQIKNLIASAKKTKPSVQKLADRAAKWLTLFAIFVAIFTLLFWSIIAGQTFVFSITLAITVLVIACPHALGLAIPTVSTIATRLAINNGIFIKDMAKIEVVKGVDYVVFDKTGTLTKGDFSVTEIKFFSEDKKTLLQVIGAIEAHSSHVIGIAIVDYLKKKKINYVEAKNIKNLSGRGMEADYKGKRYFIGNQRLMVENNIWDEKSQAFLNELSSMGKTPVFIAEKSKILGVVVLNDQIKPESQKAVKELHQLGIKVALLTGDTQASAQTVAKNLNIDTVFAQVLPEDKYKYIKKLQSQNHIVLMAGDGVNDAPALTQANTGVAIGAGTDVAIEAGDIILTQSNPEHIVRLIILSRKVYKKMIQNLFWAVGYNVITIPAAAGLFISFGFKLSPAFGALLMSLSSVIVVINAMSLKNTKLQI